LRYWSKLRLAEVSQQAAQNAGRFAGAARELKRSRCRLAGRLWLSRGVRPALVAKRHLVPCGSLLGHDGVWDLGALVRGLCEQTLAVH
jgi:hypothetical protein